MQNHQHSSNSFGQWLKSCQHRHSCLKMWSDRLIELGASWDSFRYKENDDTLVQDLVNGGIPLLAARNIVRIVTCAMRGNLPMAIFWDLESMPIPPAMTCRDVASRLKSILSPHGALVQFKGYESNSGLAGLIAQQHYYKHADLQLSGCQLADCSPNGCKEVIIVDAMSFAFSHIKGATLCFVTDKVVEDFSYLLATLHCPQWKTIVISKGVMQSAMHVICDMKIQWETDILRMYPSITPPLPSTPSLGFAPDDILRLVTETEEEEVSSFSCDGDAVVSTPTNKFPPSSKLSSVTTILRLAEDMSPFASNNKVLTTIDWGIGGTASTSAKFAPSSELPSAKQTSRKATTTSTGVITKAGKGALKEIIVVSDSGLTPPMSLSKKPPLAVKDVPEKVHQMTAVLPFVLFIARHLCPKALSKVFVTSTGKWSFLLFRTLGDVNLAVMKEPHLKQGTLVDWRRLEPRPALSSASSSQLTKKNTAKVPFDIECTVGCCQCNADPQLHTEMIQSPNGEQVNGAELYYCSEECYGWGSQEKELAVRNVVALLGVFSANDDVSVNEKILRNVLYQRYFSSKCTSRCLARLWISQAVKVGAICLFGKNKKKTKLVCLKSHCASAKLNPPSDDLDTSQEEQYVMDLLWSNNGWMTRIDVVHRLKARFPQSMQSQLSRKQVIMNASRKKSFFVATGPFGHTVGLTFKDAEAALEIAYPSPPPLLQLPGLEQEQENKKPLQANAPLVDAHTVSTKTTRSNLRVVVPFCPKRLNTNDYKKQD